MSSPISKLFEVYATDVHGEASLSRLYATARGNTSSLGRIVSYDENWERQGISRSKEREARIGLTDGEVLLKTLVQEKER